MPPNDDAETIRDILKRKKASVRQAALGPGVRQMTAQVQPAPSPTATDVFSNLLAFLRRLQAARIPYTLRHSRDDAVMVEIAVPGERWEVDFLADGDVDVEVFRSDGNVQPADGLLDKLINTHRSDTE